MGTKATSTSCPNCGRRIELKPPYLCEMCGYSMIHKRCINYPKNIARPLRHRVGQLTTVLRMSRDARVAHPRTAESVAKHYLRSRKNAVKVKVFRIWPPKSKPLWEVDGLITMRKMVLMKEEKFFLVQIDPETGDVVNFEAPPLWRTVKRVGQRASSRSS